VLRDALGIVPERHHTFPVREVGSIGVPFRVHLDQVIAQKRFLLRGELCVRNERGAQQGGEEYRTFHGAVRVGSFE